MEPAGESSGTSSRGETSEENKTNKPKNGGITFSMPPPQPGTTVCPPRKSSNEDQETTKAAYNQNFKARFAKLCQRIDNLSSEITYPSDFAKTVDDIDFVFIAEKNPSPSLSVRLANWVAKLRGYKPVTPDLMAKAREGYLAGLKEKYKINYDVIETSERYYYVIQLSFQHLGLMMELLGYQWRLHSIDPDKKAYKTFYFIKRKVQRHHEYQLDGTRNSFSARWRYDLAYHFLMGARVPMPSYSPWRNALKEPLEEQLSQAALENDVEECSMDEATTKSEKGYELMRLIADGLFDDWMVLHETCRKQKPEEINESFKRVSHSRNCCSAGCARCFFPTITCQCADVETATINNDFPQKPSCICGRALCSTWRMFWYNNLVDSADMEMRTLNEENRVREENTREYIGRIGSVRNALYLDSLKPPPEEKLAKMRHFLPLEMLNNYFGEKIGFYFGWIELFILSLIVPSMVGVAMFVCGVIYYSWAVWRADDDEEEADDYVQYVLAKACDNYATPVFAAIMVIWGTTFYEIWMRRQRWFAFLWRVENIEQTELERPPVYTFKCAAYLRNSAFGKPFMYMPSIIVTLFFIVLVIFSVYFINVMNIFSITYCPKPRNMQNSTILLTSTGITGLLETTAASIIDSDLVNSLICNSFAAAQVIANSLSMFIYDVIFTKLSYRLTDFEGHLTQSEYTDALIMKLFIFRFFNYYSVLFYIAFAIATKSVQYPSEITDGKHYDYEAYGCGQQPCMALLSRQLLSVIVTQPFLNSILDIAIPALKRIYIMIKDAKKLLSKNTNKVNPVAAKTGDLTRDKLVEELEAQYRLMELSTLDRKEFTAEEFTDKIIVYGALVMFSVALPPAPALALLIMRIDLNLDLGRVMNKFRRPIPLRAQDIGMWGNVVNFLTFIGIITNPLIVILTSSWGSRFDLRWKFIIFLVVEHVIFAVRMLVSFLVPDIPKSLMNQQQSHKMIKDEIQTDLIREKTTLFQQQNQHH